MMGVFVQVNTESLKAVSNPIGYIIEENGCWSWVSAKNADGYGEMWDGGKVRRAYRVMYERAYGKVPPGLSLDHLCRNRACVNPDHLEAVTQRVNILRGNGWAGVHARRTHCPRGHSLSGDNLVPWHLERGGRQCRSCHNAWHRAHKARKRAASQEVANAK